MIVNYEGQPYNTPDVWVITNRNSKKIQFHDNLGGDEKVVFQIQTVPAGVELEYEAT